MNRAIGKLMSGVLPVVMIVLGVFNLFAGIQMYRNHKNYPTTTCVITNIEEEYDSLEEEYEHTVFVGYTVDGTDYESELGSYASSYEVGQEMEISYNPEDPTEIQTAGVGTSLAFMGLGGVVILIGIFMVLKKIVRGRL